MNDSFLQEVKNQHHYGKMKITQDIISGFAHYGNKINDNFEMHLFLKTIYQVKSSNLIAGNLTDIKMSGSVGFLHFLCFVFLFFLTQFNYGLQQAFIQF